MKRELVDLIKLENEKLRKEIDEMNEILAENKMKIRDLSLANTTMKEHLNMLRADYSRVIKANTKLVDRLKIYEKFRGDDEE